MKNTGILICNLPYNCRLPREKAGFPRLFSNFHIIRILFNDHLPRIGELGRVKPIQVYAAGQPGYVRRILSGRVIPFSQRHYPAALDIIDAQLDIRRFGQREGHRSRTVRRVGVGRVEGETGWRCRGVVIVNVGGYVNRRI